MSSRLALFLLLAFAPAARAASPCADVRKKVSASESRALEPVLVRQLNEKGIRASAAQVCGKLAFAGWQVLLVRSDASDDGYLFFHGEPASHPFVQTWGGSGRRGQQNELRKWAVESVKGIPPKLAKCFAWSVSQSRGAFPKSAGCR